jgi:hypothetical protein
MTLLGILQRIFCCLLKILQVLIFNRPKVLRGNSFETNLEQPEIWKNSI